MARGWESKAVEEQIDAAAAKRAQETAPRKTPEQLHREHEIETLDLNRRRVLRELEAATNPRHKEMLRGSLQYLDEKLAALRQSG
jgi:broad-specificity NMP kinase